MDQINQLSTENRPDNVHRNQSKKHLGISILLVALLLVILVLSAWGYSEHKRANELAEQLATIEDGYSIADLTAFEEAFESGDYDQVRALFSEDGVLTTASNIHSAIYQGDFSKLAERVEEDEFRRLATLHGGEDLTILGIPVQVGDNTVAFAWQWGSGYISGTALLHLRDGKIVIAILTPSQYNIPFGG